MTADLYCSAVRPRRQCHLCDLSGICAFALAQSPYSGQSYERMTKAEEGNAGRSMNNVVGYLTSCAQQRPQACAVVEGEVQLTYAQLYEQSRRAGTALAQRNMARKGVVLVMEKSADMLALMMGALWAGAFYVPVDPQAPVRRLAQIVARLQQCCVVAPDDAQAQELSRELGVPVLTMQQLLSQETDDQLLAGAQAASLETDPAYVLFIRGKR